jgi:predicted nuclease of predicted toxin-antitoxin system
VKRVLFDENMPRKLRRDLSDLFVRTVQEQGWAGVENGQLLGRASGVFDVLLTADQRLRYQQNVARFSVGVVVIETVDTTVGNLRRMLSRIRAAIDEVSPGTVIVISE